MFDHIGLRTRDLARSVRFYAAALEPLGFRVEYQDAESAGLGRPGAPQLWLYQSSDAALVGATHVALAARDRAAVDAFHAAALAGGGRDNGAAGLRPHYHAGYYAAFALDPDGNNVEAVFDDPAAKRG